MLGNYSLLASGGDPLSHAIAHNLHEKPLAVFKIGGEGYNNRLFGIRNGEYEFFITNHMAMTLVVAIAVVAVFVWVARRVRPVGTGLERFQTRGRVAQLFETMCTFIREEVAQPSLRGMTDKYIYYIWTVFFFILFANLIGLIPTGAAFRLLTNDPHTAHWGGTATSNLGLNVILAMGSLVAIIGIGIREQGFKHFIGHFSPVGWDVGMLWIGIPLFVLEWMGLLIKCTVLAMRLFGTMMAGHLALAAIVGIIFYAGAYSAALGYGVSIAIAIGCVMLMMLEVLICCLQAFIFTFLSVLFISMGAVGHDEHEDPLSDEAQMDVDKVIRPEDLSPASV